VAKTEAHRQRQRYRPFDLLRAALDDSPFNAELQQDTPETLARTCLLVLSSAPELRKLPIVFLEVDAWGDPPEPVAAAMQQVLAAGGAWSGLSERMSVLRLAPRLDREDFFVLDPHLAPSGHAKIAQAIADTLRERRLLGP